MSWREPHPFERGLLEHARDRWPERESALLPLARLVCLAPRIEPLLLRNARRRLLPTAPAEVESLLWFSPLVAARSSRDIVLHLGVARLLAEELAALPATGDDPQGPTPLELAWDCTRLHTRHWSAEDRLERDLRYHALRGDTDAGGGALRAILREIGREADSARQRDLARLAKRTLPVVVPALGALPEARLLAQYAALALGEAGSWVQPGPPAALPPRLADQLRRLPPLDADDDELQLGCDLRWDAAGRVLVLHLTEPGAARQHIALPTPVPARLHVAPDGRAGEWHSVLPGSRIRIDPPATGLRLTTLDGRQWDLRTDGLPARAGDLAAGAATATPPPLRLLYVAADRDAAEAIADWLRGQDIQVELAPETGAAETEDPSRRDTATPAARSIRLWSQAARAFWDARGAIAEHVLADSLLLRIDQSAPPNVGTVAGRLLDWHWSRVQQRDEAERLRALLTRWWQQGDWQDSDRQSRVEGRDIADAHYETERLLAEIAEINHLLSEIADPATEPPRRLAIGDRLAELGDPRRGVGTVEVQVEVSEAEPTGRTETVDTKPDSAERPRQHTSTRMIRAELLISPVGSDGRPIAREAQALLEELEDPSTEPPRRLAIGNELDRLGDPRRGVGIDADGTPDIAWILMPAGSFIYQDNETRELPEFWMARYPVTNRQYQAFIDDGGYEDERWWTGLRRPEQQDPSWPHENRPRTTVDWHEATAFCRWLNARLDLPADDIRLPTEEEWERTARGTDGRPYPWGNAYASGLANVNEKTSREGPWNLGETTAVGMYPHGRSANGVDDLIGNIWEWCHNRHDQSAIAEGQDSTEFLCGGGYRSTPLDASSARTLSRLEDRGSNVGFRLCRVLPFAGPYSGALERISTPDPERTDDRSTTEDLHPPSRNIEAEQPSRDFPETAMDEPATAETISADGPEYLNDGSGDKSVPGTETFDCFLTHSGTDKPAVRDLVQHLRARGITVWLDEERLLPGMPWQPLLEAGIEASRSIVVVVGSSGLGPWQEEETEGFLRLSGMEGRPVIPVLVGQGTVVPELPLFLRDRSWVDLRSIGQADTSSEIDRLVWGISGSYPDHPDHPDHDSSNRGTGEQGADQDQLEELDPSPTDSDGEGRMTASEESTHRFGGPWTEIKLHVLRRYLDAYLTALKNQPFSYIYIDAFAGSGEYTPTDSPTTKAGSARLALESAGFDRYCFIETKDAHYERLQELTQQFPDRQIELYHGDANELLPPILSELSPSTWRGVIFLDPYGMNLDWTTLQAVANTELLDVWYLFPISGVYRQAARSMRAVDDHKAAALDRCLGTAEWREAFYRESRQLDLFGDAPEVSRFANVGGIEQFVRARLQQIFPSVSKPLRLPRAGAPLYSLFFAVSNKSPRAIGLAQKIAKAILDKAQ
jgi:three-Cys-motif partner protein